MKVALEPTPFHPHPDDFVENGMEALRIMGSNMAEIIRAADDKLRLAHVAVTVDHHRSHGLRHITNPLGNPVRVHQHLKISDGDVNWDEFFGGLAEIGFYDPKTGNPRRKYGCCTHRPRSGGNNRALGVPAGADCAAGRRDRGRRLHRAGPRHR